MALSVVGGVAVSAGPFLHRCYTEMKDILTSIQEDAQRQRIDLERLADTYSHGLDAIKSELDE